MVYRIDSPDAVEGWSSAGIRWSPWHQKRPLVRARVVTPDGVQHELDPKVLSDALAGEHRPAMYEDERVVSGPLPAVKVGAVIEEEEIVEDAKPFFAAGVVHRYWFGRKTPVRHRRLSLEYPATLPVKYAIVSGVGISVSREAVDGVVHVLFEQHSLPAIEVNDSNLPSDVSPWPYVVFSTGASWGAIAAAYNEVVEGQIASADLQATANAHKGTDRAGTIADLLAYLHEQVRYTGVEFDEANLVPRTPAEVLKRRFGDCKDKSALLVALLRAAGIPAHVALLSTGPGLDSEADHPGMGIFDHAIVYVPGTPELWIDPTAQFHRVGTLPYGDEGRLALVVSPDTSTLRRTPEATAEANVVVETREFQLADYGKASVRETSEALGDMDATYRESYGAVDSKDDLKGLEEYVKNEYLADGLSRFEHGSGADLRQPFRMTVEAAKVRRGFTDLDSGVVAIRFESLFSRFPKYLKSSDEDDSEADTGSMVQRKSPRTSDVVFQPFITEWRYRITPPAGYRTRTLPPERTISVGPAVLTYKFDTNLDGVVTGIVRLDSRKGRYTAAEARATRKTYKELISGDALLLTFDEAGAAGLAAGDVRGALAGERRIVAQRPSSVMARIHLARALLSAGLADTAREEARRAVELDSKSSIAYRTLGWVLEHDLIGRRFKRGFDLDGAIAAYRKALEIDPKDTDIRAELAIVLEHDSAGNRYSEQAKLIDAIREYRELAKLTGSAASSYDDSLLIALLYARRFKEVEATCASLPQTQLRLAIALASIAAQRGGDAAVSEAKMLARNAGDRLPALRTAAFTLRDMRRYAPAATLLAAAAEGDADAAQLLGLAQAYRVTRPYEEAIDPANPASAIQRLFAMMIVPSSVVTPEMIREFEFVVNVPDARKAEAIARMGGALRTIFERNSMPAIVGADIVITNMKFSSEGDDARGYRIRVQPMGAKASTAFVARVRTGYKIVGFNKEVTGLGVEALRRLDAGDVVGAKHWIDWVREEISLPGGDDPLPWPAFPRLYELRQDPDPKKVRRAALALVADTDYAKPYLAEIKDLVEQSASADRETMQTVLASAYKATESWGELQAVASGLFDAHANSDFAFGALADACMHTKDWNSWETAIAKRLQRLPNDPVAIRSRARLLEMQARFPEARAVYKAILDSGRATEADMNAYGWDALFTTKVEAGDIEIVQRGSGITQNTSYGIVHTLACLYADAGKTKEARDLLLHTIAIGGLNEPDSQVWYGLGRIAEQYGEPDAALRAYAHVTAQSGEEEYPNSTWNLTQLRVKLLKDPNAASH